MHQNHYTNTSTVCQVEIAVHQASAQCAKYTKTRNQCTKTSTNTPIHQNTNTSTQCIARLVECGGLLPRQDCLHHRGHWVHGQGGRLSLTIKFNIILIFQYQPHFDIKYEHNFDFKQQHHDRDHDNQVLVEKLLRSTGVKKLYLLIRPRCELLSDQTKVQIIFWSDQGVQYKRSRCKLFSDQTK